MKRSPKNLQITFSGQRLTHFGGLYLLQKYYQKINLRSLLSQYIRFSQRNNRYTIAEEILALIYPILFPTTSLSKKCHYPSRQGLLRPQDCGIFGIQESPFRHCCQTHKAYKEKIFNSILQEIFIRYRDCRVYVSTNRVEKGISFCGNKASYSRRPHRAAYPFLHWQIQLPDYCNKYEAQSSQYMEVLQWSSLCRTYYQRTKRGLPLCKNTDETFCSQRVLFSHPSVFLQSHKLVQTAMSTKGVSEHDA